MSKGILELKDITKVYDNGIVANKKIDLEIWENEIHAIVGENGAGKSTLMKIIFGMEQPTMGKYFLHGAETQMSSVEQAIRSGIGMVHQHFMLVESMDVVDNIMLGIEPKKGMLMDKKAARKMVQDVAEKYRFQLNYDKPVSEISIGMKQKVEIIKALIRGAKILILDEPTAVLTPQETQELFVQLKMLTKLGHTILFISHKLKEVKEISDRITVIRKGETRGTFPTEDLEIREISNLMVGRDVSLNYEKTRSQYGEVLLEMKNVTSKTDSGKMLKNISFELQRGMILGVAGVEGNGQSELVEILTKREESYDGEIRIFKERLKNHSIKSLRSRGLGYIPEDRMTQGIAAEEAISDNLISTRFHSRKFGKRAQLDKNAILSYADEAIRSYEISCHGNDHIVGYLSGGNIQKVVVGRECDEDVELLIAEQPTRGVDLGAAELIHHKLLDMRERGAAILLISADMNEIV